MSFFSFNIVGNALDAYQQAENVVSDNIANVSTPGASRQSAVVTQAVPIDGSPFYSPNTGFPNTKGEGAVVDRIARIHQDSYDTLFRTATSSQYYYTTEQEQLTTLQSNFGEPNNGVNTAFTNLQTAISASSGSTAAAQTAYRTTVLSAAQTFVTSVNAAGTAIAQQKASVQSQAESAVTQANSYIDQIASLNGQIRALTAVGDNPNTYLDQRDYAIDQLSQIVPTTTILQNNGSSTVSVAGRALVTDTIAYHLASPVIGTASNGQPTLVVGMANDPTPTNPSPVPLAGARLGAFTDLYNNKLAPYGQQLDNFASSTADEMNRITQAGVDSNGNPGAALFIPAAGSTSVTAASITLHITETSQLPLAMLSTSAGNLTQAMNSATNQVSTTA